MSVIVVSVCLPSDALLQHLQSYFSFSYLGRGVSLNSCSIKAQLLLLTLEEGYLLTAALPDLQHGIAPIGPPAPAQPLLLGRGLIFPATAPSSDMGWLLPAPDRGLLCRVAPPDRCPRPRMRGGSSRPFLHHCSLALLATAPDLGSGAASLGCTECNGRRSYLC